MPALVVLFFSALISLPSTDGAASLVRVKTVEGSMHEGVLDHWQANSDLVVLLADGPLRIHASNVDVVSFSAKRKKLRDATWIIEAHDGTRLLGEIAGGGEDGVTFQHHEFGKINLPLERLAAVTRRGKPQPIKPDQLEDAVFLVNGDLIGGAITNISQESISIFSQDTEHVRSWAVVKAVYFATSIAESTTAKPTIRIQFADGSQLPATALIRDDKSIQVVLPDGQKIRCHNRFPVLAEMVGGRRVWLTDLKPSSYQSIPFLKRTWPLAVHSNALGGPLRIAGKEYSRGFGLHSACKLQWQLDGRYERLMGQVGIDDLGGKWADADVSILLDKKVLVEFRNLRHGQPPREFNVELRGGRKLTVSVDYGRHGHVQDRVNIVNPALILRSPNQ